MDPKRSFTFFKKISDNVEVQVTMQVRFYNGIHSDPKVILRAPTIPEILDVAKSLRPPIDISDSPHLDF